MSLRRKQPADSLYMLLDTMCNAFGGIILLAVLVTLLTSKERQSQSGTPSDTTEMLQRRLAIAQTNLQQSLQLSASLQARSGDPRWHQQVSLLTSRAELTESLQRIREAEVQANNELESVSASDPSDRAKALNAQFAAAQARKVELQNSLLATEQNTQRLKQRLASLSQQVKVKSDELVRDLRLPKEYQTGKRVLYLIVQYGRVYPCRNADFSRNDVSIHWRSHGDSDIAEPIRGQGLGPSELQAFLRTVPKDVCYGGFCVFEDSFPAFIAAEKMATANGLAYGWEPFQDQDGPVTFSSNGHVPKPQ